MFSISNIQPLFKNVRTFLLFSYIGFVQLFFRLFCYFNAWLLNDLDYHFTAWVDMSSLLKISHLLTYGFSLAIAFLLFCLVAFVKFRDDCLKNKNSFATYFFPFLTVSLYAFTGAIFAFLWIIFFFVILINALDLKFPSIKFTNLFYKVIFGLTFILMISIIVSWNTLHDTFDNDYIELSGVTKLTKDNTVDTLNYINQHKLLGLSIWSDSNEGLLCDDRLANPRIFGALYLGNNYLTSKKTEDMDLSSKEAIECSKQMSSFMLAKNYTEFTDLGINYTNEEINFLNFNKSELIKKFQAGWFFHHHNYFFGPMNAWALGSPIKDQVMVYGLGPTIGVAETLKLMGGVNYQNYFKVLPYGFLIYFILFLAFIWSIFKNIAYLMWSSIALLMMIFLLGSELISLAPGLNPVRHILDIPVFFLISTYLKKPRVKEFLFLLTLAIGSILWNKEFGFFLSISTLIVLSLREFFDTKSNKLRLIFIFISFTISIFLYKYQITAPNNSTTYALIGVNTPVLSPFLLFLLIFSLSSFYLLIYSIKGEVKLLVLAVLLYLQMSIIYFLWYPRFHHFLTLIPIILIISLFFYDLKLKSFVSKDKVSVLLLFAFIFSSSLYFMEEIKIKKARDNHMTYDWKFEAAQIKSTANPLLLEKSVNLIKKYSNKSQSIYMISKYDNLLPILAGKYNLFPYNELVTNLVTYKDIDYVAKFLTEQKPEYIFVDRNIRNFHFGQIVNPKDPYLKELHNGYPYESSVARGLMLYNLTLLYESFLRPQYEPIESDGLITVFRLR